MSIRWIQHKNRKILYSDYAGLPEADRIAQLREEQELVLSSPEPVLLLHHISQVTASKDLMKVLKEQQGKIQHKIVRSACTGILGLQHMFLTAVNRMGGTEMKPFTDEAEALDWLARG